MMGRLDRMPPRKTPIRLQIASCNIIYLACTDFVQMYIFWDSSTIRYFVGVNCLPLILVVLSSRSLPSLHYYGQYEWFVEGLVLTVLLVSFCCFVYLVVTIFCLCLSVNFSATNGFIPFRLPLVDALSVSFPVGRREVFLFGGLLVACPIVAMDFSVLIHNNSTDTTLALTCKSQFNCFPSTPVCFRSPTNSTESRLNY